MKKRKLIYNEDLLFKIIVASGFIMFLKDGLWIVLLLFIYFFINEIFEKKKYNEAKEFCKKRGIPFH